MHRLAVGTLAIGAALITGASVQVYYLRPAAGICVEPTGAVFVPWRDCFVCRVVAIRVALILKTTRSQYGSPFDAENDYVVLHGGRVVGRIFLSPQAPQGCPWFWTITAREHPASIHSRGYSATREQAMAHFKAQWQS